MCRRDHGVRFTGYHTSEIWDQRSHTSVSQNWSHTSYTSVRSILRDTSVGSLSPNFTSVVSLFPHTELDMFKMKWNVCEKMSENSAFYYRTYQQKYRKISKTTKLRISHSRCEKICRKLPFFWYIVCFPLLKYIWDMGVFIDCVMTVRRHYRTLHGNATLNLVGENLTLSRKNNVT